jgi:hypothetical protein
MESGNEERLEQSARFNKERFVRLEKISGKYARLPQHDKSRCVNSLSLPIDSGNFKILEEPCMLK